MTPESNSSCTSFPLSLAIPMMECFFGTGPRYRERAVPPVPPSPSSEPASIDSALSSLSVQSSVPGFRPRGTAATPHRPAAIPKQE